MFPKTLFTAGFTALFLIFSLSACSQDTATTEQEICTELSASVDCILELAVQNLDGIDDAFTQASAMAELAVAYDSADQHQTAIDLIERAMTAAGQASDEKIRVKALGEIAVALADMKHDRTWTVQIAQLINASDGLESADAKAEILSKSLIAQAAHGDIAATLDDLINLPQSSELQDNAKAVALRKSAKIFAKRGDFKMAEKAINEITMSISYYRSISRTDVAYIAAKSDNKELAGKLLTEAEPIARDQENGYFGAGLLRDIAFGYAALGENVKAAQYYKDAQTTATTATKQNEKARATSRIATKKADVGDFDGAAAIMTNAAKLADDIDSEMLKGYSFYEIVGSAAISGEFELANAWLDKVPDTPLASTASLKNAALRDIAWGLMKHGRTEEALTTVSQITTPREKIQALSRIIRVLNNPKMAALPRYP